MRGFPDQPLSAGSELRGSAVQQEVRQGGSSENSPRSRLSCDSPHQAADHRAELGLSRQKGGSSVAACPNIDQRSAPQRQVDSTLPRSGSHLRGLESSKVNRNREPALKGRSAPGGAQEPVAEVGGDKPRSMSSWSFSKFSLFSSAAKPSGENSGSSPPKHVKQGKVEARSSLLPETHSTLSQTSPLEAGLKALRDSSHPQSSEFLHALERPIQIVNDLLSENQHLQKELNSSHVLREHLWQELQKRQSVKRVSEHHLVAENQRLQQKLEELQELKNTQEALVADLQAKNQELQQELEELRKGLVPESEPKAVEVPVPQIIAFPVQVQRSGDTRGYEKQFLCDVARLLDGHKVSLQVEEYQEGSTHLLLLFSSIAVREGADINNALNGLKSMQKVLLVVFHHKPKSNTKFFADIKPQVQHPALVGTVHACFSIQDGFYPCQVNQDAVESVATTIMELTQDG